MSAPLEKDIQNAILDYLKLKGVFCWQNKTQGTYDPTKKTFRRPMGRHWINGIADILGITRCGIFLAIEVKRPGGKATPEQAAFLAEVQRRKPSIAFIATSVKDAQDRLIDILER